jgi:hypothetical protein
MTWFSDAGACGVMLGDDRATVRATTTHGTIGGGLQLHSAQPGYRGICLANVGPKREIKGVTLTGLLCLAGDACLDLGTGFDARSPSVSNLTFDGNTCMEAMSTCIKFPSVAPQKVSHVVVGNNASASHAYLTDWIPSMGSRPISAVLSGSASDLGTAATTYLGNGNVATPAPGSADISPWVAPVDGVLGRLRCAQSAASGEGQTRRYDVQLGSTDAPGHGCAIAGASALACVAESTTTKVAAGDRVRVRITRSGAAPTNAACTLDFYATP